ncbi:Serine/threonine-protein kinase TBK1 [Nymphon striatum]|nr:Serine/threonine-protein kinase TBK1 [Nymphon striatum]
MVVKMSLLKSSQNYIWCTSSILGKGATGAVHQGIHKLTGKAVAVKSFNHISHMRPQDVQMREFEALKILNHENIVKLLAIEEEQNTHSKVIVMELCTGGSLFTILDDPEKHYGLEETEFILVLNHLASGMNHLRGRKLIHRDLKPGNIMKYIGEDGRSIYKLVDFGAARELEDGQQFMSLYGTEEYLHPDMYERAVLHKPVSKTFDATVDLWSIGVTLFHIATGVLPFRPYGGRKNQQTMHSITTEKESGVISGVQLTEHGRINWSTELPKTCQFSLGLRNLITPVLAGLLESDSVKMWGFTKFFSKVTELVSKKIIEVIFVNDMIPLRLFLDENYLLKDLQAELKSQTGIIPSNQLLLFDNRCLNESTFEELNHTLYTSIDNPLILLDRNKSSIDDRLSSTLLVKFPIFPSTVSSVENDAALGKISCSVAYAVQRLIQKVVIVQQSLLKVPPFLSSSVKSDVQKLKNTLSLMTNEMSAINMRMELLASLHKSHMQLLSIAGQDENSEEDVFIKRIDEIVNERLQAKIANHLRNTEAKVDAFQSKIIHNKQMTKEWKDLIQNIATDLSCCPDKARTHTKKIRDSWHALVRDKAAGNLVSDMNIHDQQFHNLEKIKIHEASQKLMSVLNDESINCCIQLAERLKRWYNNAMTSVMQYNSFMNEVTVLKEEININQISLQKAELEYKQQTEMIISMMRTKQCLQLQNRPEKLENQSVNVPEKNIIKPRPRPCSCDGINYRGLDDLVKAQSEVRTALSDHKQMIHEFEKLTLRLVESNSATESIEH